LPNSGKWFLIDTLRKHTMNCKAGDLAVVIGSSRLNSPNIGRIVEVVSFDQYCPVHGPMWVIKAERPLDVVLVDSNGYSTGLHLAATSAVTPDKWLRPLPPQNTVDEVLREAELAS
jgi:hypothetical protein